MYLLAEIEAEEQRRLEEERAKKGVIGFASVSYGLGLGTPDTSELISTNFDENQLFRLLRRFNR